MRASFIAALLLAIVWQLPVFAQKTLEEFCSDTDAGNIHIASNTPFFKIELDQDVLNSKMNDDRDYTMGLNFQFSLPSEKIERMRSGIRKKWWDKNNTKDEQIPFLYTFSKYTTNTYVLNTQWSFTIKGMAFTPDNIKTQAIVSTDRPFAGVTTFGFARSTMILPIVSKIERKARPIKNKALWHSDDTIKIKFNGPVRQSSFNFAPGFMGTNFYQGLQGYIHKLGNPLYKDTINCANPFYPYGWKNQISGKGTFTLLVQYGMNWLLTRQYFLTTYQYPVNKKGYAEGQIHRIPWYHRYFEVSANTGGSIGYYNAVSANIQLRAGRINPLKWMNSLNTLNNSNYTANFSHKENIADNFKGMELFVYANLGGHAMFYNALLRGQIINQLLGKDDPYVLSASQIRPLFYDFNFGVGFSTRRFQLYYAPYVFRSSEVKLKDIAMRKQYWGKIGLFINLNRTR